MKLVNPIRTLNQAVTATASALVLVLAVGGLFVWGRSRATEAVYRDRLRKLCNEYATLCNDYNAAVRRTAVAELDVRGNRLSVVYRAGGRDVKTVPLPYSTKREIYVDFVVIDGRLLIRRVFDDRTPPDAGVLLDPRLLNVDWNRPGVRTGKAVYRRLSEGRWRVTVTGNGSLGLERVPKGATAPVLALAPAVKSYPQVVADIQAATRAITLREIAASAFSGK